MDELLSYVRVSSVGIYEEIPAAYATVALEVLFGHGEDSHPYLVGGYA